MAPRKKDYDSKERNYLSVERKSKCSNNINKKVVVNIPDEVAVPNSSFTYTYEVLDYVQPGEFVMSASSGIKIKPLHTLQSNEPVTKVMMNNNYTYENTEEENEKMKMMNIEKTNANENIGLDLSTSTNPEILKEEESLNNIEDDEIFAPSLIIFSLAKTKKTPSVPPDQIVCEAASRILFQSISWSLQIPVFKSMMYPTQVALIRNSWLNLFILGLAQCKDQLNLNNLVKIITYKLQNYLSENATSLSKLRQLTNTITKITAITNSLEEMNVDHTEFAFLRLCSVFQPGQQTTQLRRITENIYQRVLSAFQENSREKFGKLIQLLFTLKSFPQNILEELFFSSLIGNVPIDNVIPFIISMKLK